MTTVVALRPGKRRALSGTPLGRLVEQVEHPFHIVKHVRYSGLAKNTAQLFTLFGLANLLIAKRRPFALHSQGAS